MIDRPRWILAVIVIAQFAGTSLWFAGNAVMSDLQLEFNLPDYSLGWMTSSVQLGFITGTLIFAYFGLSDRFSPRNIYLICSIVGGLSNLSIYWVSTGLSSLMIFRFLTGFFLAGIYPIGMKIAAGWYKEGLGKALGFLVGALVLGTAFPHLIKSIGAALPWSLVIISVSIIAATGGVLMYIFVPDGPYVKKGTLFNPNAIPLIFRSRDFRAAAFGYFGHMWELYALYTFIPLMLQQLQGGSAERINISWWSFLVIAMGTLGCIFGGLISLNRGSSTVAFSMLLMSGICCAISPLLFTWDLWAAFFLLLVWGFSVVGDSPQFSTLVANTAPPEFVGTALTLVNSIGFAITIFSIELLNYLALHMPIADIFVFLVPGPLLGLYAMRHLLQSKSKIS